MHEEDGALLTDLIMENNVLCPFPRKMSSPDEILLKMVRRIRQHLRRSTLESVVAMTREELRLRYSKVSIGKIRLTYLDGPPLIGIHFTTISPFFPGREEELITSERYCWALSWSVSLPYPGLLSPCPCSA